MKIRRIILVLIISFLLDIFLFNQSIIFAKTIEEEIQELKARITELEKKFTEQHKKSEEQEETISKQQKKIEHIDTHMLHKGLGVEMAKGLKLGLGATFVVRGAIDVNNTNTKNEDITDASYSIDLELEKTFDDFGMAFLHLETGDGAGVEDELTLFSNVNRDADDSNNAISLTEIWYEHYLFDNQLTITFGKLEPPNYVDQNAIANDEHYQFLGRIFRNVSTIPFPDNTVGIRSFLNLKDASWLEIEAQILDGDNDWEDIGDHIFASAQLNFKPILIPDRENNYRFYGWYKDTDHIKWKDTTKMQEKNYGFGTSIDQEITDIITLFGRYGWQNPEVYASGADFSLEHTCSIGCQILGSLWGRGEDHLGLAIGMDMPSDDYKDAQNRKADNEGHFETYYSCRLNEHLTISPDFQLIWNAYGKDVADRDNTIYIIGTRSQVDF